MKQTTLLGHRTVRGFTLIELMVVVAAVAILASVALPSYASYMQRSRVPAALFALSSFQVRMEMQFQDVGGYGNAGNTACAVTPPVANNFVVSCVPSADGQAFVADAKGTGPMDGYQYRIDQLGTRTTISHPNGVPSGNCWTVKGRICES